VGSNQNYTKSILNEKNILFVQETWLVNNEDFHEIFSEFIDYKTYCTATIQTNTKGRPSKGSGWIIKKHFFTTYRIINDRISILQMNNIAFIGVYLPYNDGTITSRIDFELELRIVIHEYEFLKSICKDVIIIGDFNVDPYRRTIFDPILFRTHCFEINKNCKSVYSSLIL
jgi:exonuclease III